MADEGPPQDRVCGVYDVRDRIGSGGFADVWRAVSDEGQEVAVKFPKTDAANDAAEIRERFDRAYRALSSFEGGILPTSLVRFVDGRRDSPVCLVTELIEGEELSSAVTRSGVSPGMDAVWTFGVPIARALGLLHLNNYIYLDCKPENVLIRESHDRPVLIDFNTAESLTEANDTLFYQDAYKAPEQVPGAAEETPSGPYTDVYGVGKLLAFLLTGQTLETAETPTSGMDVTEYGANPPADIAKTIQQATRADPDERPANCCELVSQLYRADGRDPTIATITDVRNNVICPVRPGDTLGRVSDGEPLPTLSVADPERYISPVHLEFDHDDGWVVYETSLNGTFFEHDSEWRFMLSEEGYEHLNARDHPRVQDGQPFEAARLAEPTLLSPVDESYPVRFRFDPESP